MTKLKHCRAADLSMDEARRVIALTNGIWPHKDKTVEELARSYIEGERSDREVFSLWDDGQVVAHAAIFPTRVYPEGGELEVMGLAGVCVVPHCRGQGLGARVVRAALGQVDQGRFALALFQTEVPDFYARFGAVTVDNEFWNSLDDDDPYARPWWNPYVMIYPDVPEWPEGPIDLNGPGY